MNQDTGLAMVYSTIQQQASLMVYNDVYRYLAILAALFVPVFLLLGKAAPSAAAGH